MELLNFPQYRTITSRQSGSFLSSFVSHGGDFQEIREYQPGDNIARIDWAKTLSRGSDPLVRSYQDEVDRSLDIFIDISPTLRFSDGQNSKIDCLMNTLQLLIRSSWIRQMNGSIAYMTDSGYFTTSLPTNLTTLESCLQKLKSTILQSHSSDTIHFTKFITQKSLQDAFVFVISDDPDGFSTKVLSEMSKQNLVYLLSIHHPFEEVILADFEFVASDGTHRQDVAIDALSEKAIKT
ncbi:MAG: DUF58 domain-containing protein [Patescibacteria group bacterium]